MNLKNYLVQESELKEILGENTLRTLEKQLSSIFKSKHIDGNDELIRKLLNHVIQKCRIDELNIDSESAKYISELEEVNHVFIKSCDDYMWIFIDGIEIKKISHLNIDKNAGETSKITLQFEGRLESETITRM